MAKILIVEDDPSIRRVIALALKSAGYETVEADTGNGGRWRRRLRHAVCRGYAELSPSLVRARRGFAAGRFPRCLRLRVHAADVESACEGDRARVSVTDYGVGIPTEHLSHLFERFYRVSKSRLRALGGMGLGLAIVKHIVQLHGGTVSVSSDPGRKTVFSFELPAAID